MNFEIIQSRMLWKLYFVFIILLEFSGLRYGVSIRIWDLIGYVVSLVSIIGGIGFSFKIKLINKIIWKIAFAVMVIWEPMYLLILRAAYVLQGETIMLPTSTFYVAVVLIINIPIYVSLYNYGFKSNDIWQYP